MCDYSLMAVPNRLAWQGEHLVAHRFPTGSMGLAAPPDVEKEDLLEAQHRGFWAALKSFFTPPPIEIVTAVCVPPGTRLKLHDIPESFQRQMGFSETEHVMFTQLSAAVNRHRDAIRFSNGHQMLLQELHEGQRVEVLDLSSAETFEPFEEGATALRW
jgi:hypothetical protein